MLQNYLLIAFRNFLKNKLHVIVNVLGIGVAIACCIVAYYNVRFHYNFNNQHSKKTDIYKVALTKDMNGRQQPYGITPLTLGPSIENTIMGVEQVVRYTNPTYAIRYEENIFDKRIGFTDETFLEMFDLNIISGDKNRLKDKNSILINQSLAKVCFGDDEALGKTLTVYNNDGKAYNLMVGAVYEDFPENSSFRSQALCLIDNYIDMNKIDEFSWRGWVAATFLLIPDESKVPIAEQEIKKFVDVQNDARKDWIVGTFYIESLSKIPSSEREIWNAWLNQGLHPAALLAPPLMAIILLILACLNFMNTALATSSSRLKEIGIRKTMGSSRRNTIMQFLGENLLVCFLGMVTGLLISSYLLDAYSDMWPWMTLKMNLTDSMDLWLVLLGLLLFTGLLAGAYPAFYISKFNPVNILKGDVKYSGAGLFSKILLVLQFTIAIMGLVSANIFIQNAYYQETLDMGYDKENIIAVPVDDKSKLEGLKNEIVQNPLITSVGVSEEHIGWGNYMSSLKWAEEEHEVRMFDIGRGYFDAMGLELVKGSTFDKNFKESDRNKAVIVNEKLLVDYGWKDDPIGKRLRMNDTTELRVVGVVKDFYPYGFWVKIGPMGLRLGATDRMRFLIARVDEKNLTKVNEYLQTTWDEIIPNEPYAGFYQEERLAEAKDVNKQIKKIFNFLAIASVLLSLVGLYTLVSLTIIKKTKEIGIRKVLGAPFGALIRMINRDYLIILTIASGFGAYLGYFASNSLMGSIWEYHMDISILNLIIPVALMLIVSATTILRKVYIATNQNPVESLKYE